jgi:hypothetical protein
MSARRGCDRCDRITVWVPDTTERYGIRCTVCGSSESGDGYQWDQVARGKAGQFPHEPGCSRPNPKVRPSAVLGGHQVAECPECHGDSWVVG